jgi:hypothetical protein
VRIERNSPALGGDLTRSEVEAVEIGDPAPLTTRSVSIACSDPLA